MIESDPGLIHQHLRTIAQAIADGRLTPLPLRSFDFDETPLAFRFMAQAKHIGKIVIRHPSALPVFNDRLWITGGQGAIGMRMAQWLAGLGARHLVLSSRRAGSGIIPEPIAALRAQGLRVEYRARRCFKGSGFASCSQNDRHQHASPCRDRPLCWRAGRWRSRTRNLGSCATSSGPESCGKWRLHEATATKALDFFICCSSMASVTGSPSQYLRGGECLCRCRGTLPRSPGPSGHKRELGSVGRSRHGSSSTL